MKKMIPILAIAGIALVGCAAPAPSTSGDAPADPKEDNYSWVEQVDTPRGEVTCVLSKVGYSGGITCDWDNVVVE